MQAPVYGSDAVAQKQIDHDSIFAIVMGGMVVLFFPFMALVLWWMGLM